MTKKECNCGCGMRSLIMGVGIFALGLVKYLGYSWEMALMILGALTIIKGIVVNMTCCCK